MRHLAARRNRARGAKSAFAPSKNAIFRYKAGARRLGPPRHRSGNMADDSFIREVNEEMRQAQARALWDRFGPAFLALALAAVLATAAWVGWDYWVETKANASGDAFSQALTLANEGKDDEALAALKSLEESGYGAYPVLARMRSATVLASKGDFAGAVAGFDAVAADSAIPESLRDVARLRAAYLLVDSGSYEDVASRVEALSSDDNALRHSAREAMGLAAWKAGRTEDALRLFDQITADTGAPRNTADRARVMGELIRGGADAS